MKIGKQIASVRRMKKISQAALCEKLKISHPTLINIEHGTGNPSHDTVMAICKELGIEVKTKAPQIKETDNN